MLLKEEHIKIYFNKFKVIPPEQQENIDNRKIVATILKNMECHLKDVILESVLKHRLWNRSKLINYIHKE